MKRINFTNFVFCVLMLFAFQAQAQYSGVAYRGETPQIGETVGTPVKIEMEHFDALASDPNGDGANYGAAAAPLTAGGTYWDKSPGSETPDGNPIRTGSDVDIEAGATGAVIAKGQGQEFTVYTVNIVTAGTYHMGVNYTHGGTSKDIRLESFDINGENRIDLYNTLDVDGLPASGGEYVTTDNLGSFSLPAGPLLLKFTQLDAGPRYDFFTLTLDEADVVEPEGYFGVAYKGETPQIGETVGTPVKIEMEHYDALAADPNGDGANFNDDTDDIPVGVMGTYFDKSAGGSEQGNPIRTGSDVDIEAGATGAVIAGAQGQEYTIYTVNVVTAGTYHMGVNYTHGGTSKDIKLFSHATDGTGKTLLYDSVPDDGLPASGGEYITTDDLGSFSLPAGPLLLRFRHLDAGPRFDFFTLTLDEADVVNNIDFAELEENALKAFPNPASNGIFNVDIEEEWEVYSLVGAKVLKGTGSQVNLSNLPKGIYILKTPNASVKLISK
ncbi:MAG: T9SS type A sorting domain-containing protein [Saprospiraceae bacterium]